MKRRYVLQSLSASLGALLAMPTWANGWNVQSVSLSSPPLLSSVQESLLNEVVSTIIPEGSIQGAKSLGVPAFIQKMIADCYEKNAQDDFKKGLDEIENISQKIYNQAFTSLTSLQKQDLLKGLAVLTDTKQKEFYGLLKSLTIQGYTTSEYVMVNHLKYVMAPGHYYGCVSV